MSHRVRAPVVLVLALAGVSFSGPLVRLSHAHPLAIAAWRLGFSLVVIALALLITGEWRQWRRISRRELVIALGAGSMLALHFWSWNTSVALTSVAASVVLVNTQPVVVALLSMVWLREAPSSRQWIGIGIAMLGALVVAAPDLARSAAAASAASARAPRRPPRARRGAHGRDLFRRRPATARVARSLAVRRPRLRHLLRRAPRARRCSRRRAARAAATARAGDLRRACARSHAARSHGAELGAQAFPGLRGEPHAARRAGRAPRSSPRCCRESVRCRRQPRCSAGQSCSLASC